MRSLLTILAAAFVFGGSLQTPKLEGPWYGIISAPDGMPLDTVLNIETQATGWSGTLSIGGGQPAPVRNVTVSTNSLSFTIDLPRAAGQATPVFNGRLTDSGETLDGEITLVTTRVKLKLTRSMPSVPAEVMDPDEMVDMMASLSGPLSERPFVPPVTYPAIGYGIRPVHDPVANLIADIQAGKVQLKFEDKEGYLHSLLDVLKVPVESQMAVFSKTSVQAPRIGPDNPRKLYFNDNVVIGSVGGGFIEMAAQDPEQGINFYTLEQFPDGKPRIAQGHGQCLVCHLTRNSMDIPGMIVRSVYTTDAGVPINPLGFHLLDHRTPIENRFGGWYVTGSTGSMKHLGNSAFTDAGE